MGFLEWKRAKEKEEEEKKSSSSTTTTRSSSASPSTSNPSKESSDADDSTGSSFLDWVRKNKAERSSDSAQNWYDSGRSLLNEVKQYYSDPKWGGGDSDYYSDFQSRASDLLASADSWRKKYAGNEKALSSIDSMVSELSDMKQGAMKTKDYYSQWESEDDYNMQYGYADKYKGKTYDEIKTASAEATGSEAEWLKSYSENYGYADDDYYAAYAKSVDDRLAEIDVEINAAKAEGKTTNTNFDQKGVTSNSEYIRQNDIDALEAERTELLAQKKRTQYLREGYELGSVADPNSSTYDPEFKKYSEVGANVENPTLDEKVGWFAAGGWQPFGKEVQNDVTYALKNKDEYIKESGKKAANGGNTSMYGINNLVYEMEDDEIAIYNYYIGKGDKESADKYLDSLEETLNSRIALKNFKAMEGDTAGEIAIGAVVGLDQFASGVKNFVSNEEDYIPSSAIAQTGQMVREDLDDNGFDIFGNSLGQVAYDMVTTTANMAPSIALGTIPVIGKGLGLASMGVSAAGNAYAEAINNGYSKGQARAYSTLVGASEAGLSYILSGIGKLGGKISGELIGKLTSGISNAYAHAVVTIGGNMVSEFTEEALQEVLDPFFKNIALNANNDLSDVEWSQVAYSGLLGALSAGVLEGGDTVAGEVDTYKAGKTIMKKGEVDNLVKFGKSLSADSVAYKLADKVNENTGAYTIGRLLHEAGADSLSETNISEIEKSLVRKGVAPENAGTIATWLNKAVEGGHFNRSQRNALENNEIISQTFKDIVLNQNSTVNQRVANYNSLASLASEVAGVSPKADGEQAPASVDTTGFALLSDAEVKKRVADDPLFAVAYGQFMRGSNSDVQEVENASSPATKDVDLVGRVSSNGQTTRSSTGESVTIDKNNPIAKVVKENGEDVVYYNTDLGEVESSDINYSSKSEGLIHESFTDMNPAIANAAIKAYDGTMPVQTFVAGMREGILMYGKHNFKEVGVDISADSDFAKLSKVDQEFALGLGRKLAEIETNSIDKGLKSAIRTAAENVAKTTKGKPAVKGKVTFEAGVKAKSNKQKASVIFAEKLAAVTGIRIVFYDSKVNPKHEYADADGASNANTIWLDMSNSHEDAIAYTLSHEFVHFAKKWSEKEFKVFADFMVEQFAAHGKNTEKLVRDKMEEIGTTDWDYAFEEVVCDACERMLMDSNAMEKLAALKKKDPGVFEKFIQHIKDLLNKLRSLMADTDATNEYSKELHDMTDVLERFMELFENMAVDAVQNFQAATEADADFVDKYLDTKDIKHNLKLTKTHREDLANGYKEKDADIDLPALLKRYNKIIDLWEELGGELDSKFLNEWNAKGKDKSFTIFKAQSGYKYNVELSSMCKKGVPLFEAIDQIVKKEVLKKLNTETIGKAEKEILYDILKQHDFEIPCAICYVEQARQREGVIIDAFLKGKVEKDSKGKVTTFKLGWNEVLAEVSKEMHKIGVDYTFPNVDRSIATEEYTAEDITMDTDTEAAFREALKKVANKEIRRYNKEKKASRSLVTSTSPAAINSVFKGTLPSNLKIFKVLFNNPKSRFMIGSDLLYSSMTTRNLAMSHNDLYGLFNSQGGVSGYKTKQGTVVYWGDILNKKWSPSTIRKEGGVRNQSNSDFQMYTLLDHAQMYIDFSAKGYYLQAYTKVLSELKLFGLSRGKINASLIPKVAEIFGADGKVDYAKTQENAGLDENGELLFDDFEGINHAEAFMLIADPEYSKNICGICIGYSDNHIFKMLDDSRIQLIIGFHDKTDDPSKRYRGARYAKNYNGLNEASKLTKDGEWKTVHVGFNKYISKAEKMFKKDKSGAFYGEAEFNDSTYVADDIPRLAADMYLADYDVPGKSRPAYDTFKGHRNYYKLLADFGLYDSEGHYAPHRKVVYNMPDTIPYLDKNGNKAYMKTKDYIKAELEKELDVRDSISEALADESENGIIPQFVKRVNEVKKQAKKSKKEVHFIEDKFFRSQMRKWETLQHGSYVKVGEVKEGNPLCLVGMPDGTIRYDVDKLKKNMADHGDYLDVNLLNEIPGIISGPVAISEFSEENTVSVFGDVFVGKSPMMVGVTISKDRAGNDISKVRTYNTRRDVGKLITDDTVLYLDENKKRTQEWFQACGIQVPLGGTKFGFIRSIAQNPKSVKMQKKKTSYAPTFYSQMGRVIDDIKDAKIGASSIVPHLKKRGIRNDEIKWSGIEAFLEGKKSVTKEELQEFAAGSQLEITERTLSDKELPYTEDQKKRMSEYTEKRDAVAKKLSDEWKRIVGEEIPIRNFGAGVDSDVAHRIVEINAEYKKSTFEGRLLKKLRADVLKVIERNDDFGFDSPKLALISIHRNRKDFAKNQDMPSADKAVIVKYCNALNAYNELPGKISDADEDILRGLAEEAHGFSVRIHEVKMENYAEVSRYKPRWQQYSLNGGDNYREILFYMPNSSYYNDSMTAHWGVNERGVLAHARIQDFDTAAGRMLFIEEIQSDWHNAGHKDGYENEEATFEVRHESHDMLNEPIVRLYRNGRPTTHFLYENESGEVYDSNLDEWVPKSDSMWLEELSKYYNSDGNAVPNAPFRDTYHEYVLKRLIRIAAEEGYDSIGWTPAEIQDERWTDNREHEEGKGVSGNLVGYTIEYDQDIPKFLRKYGKKWGATVETTTLDNGTEVWSMAIPDSMKESVLYEGQVKFQKKKLTNRTILANALESAIDTSTQAGQNELNTLRKYQANIAKIEELEAHLAEVKGEIHDLSFSKGKKDTKRLRELNEDKIETANRINVYDRRLLGLEATKPLMDVLKREKELVKKRTEQKGKEAMAALRAKNAAVVRELIARNQEARKRGIESRNKTDLRHKIKDIVADLNKVLLNPTKEKHIPIGLQRPVAEALDVINMDTVNAEERIARYNELIVSSSDPDKIAAYVKSRDYILYQGENLKEKLTAFKDAYKAILESDDPLVKNSHDDAIQALIESTVEKVGATSLRDMTLEQLEAVYDMFKAVRRTVQTANKLFKESRQATISESSEAVKAEVLEVGGHKDLVREKTKFLRKQGWNSLKPIYAMRMIGSDTLTDLYSNVRKGEDTWAVDVNEAREYFRNISNALGYRTWDLEKQFDFLDMTGQKFTLTVEQMMSLYAYSKRKQADKHLEFGGFVFGNVIKEVKNKLGVTVKYEVNDANPYKLSRDIVEGIASKLTAEQRAFVDAMQKYLSKDMGAKGNEISLALYDIKLFKEKNYFPLRTSRYFREFDPEKNGTPKIKNSGFSKETVPQAGNPIVLENFMDVWANHVNEMSMYHAFVLPLEDFMRVYNYSSTAGGYDSVQQYIKNAYTDAACQYIETLLKDLNGGARTDPAADVISKGIGLYKKAAVFTSASVVVQQPSALARAMAVVDAKYFATHAKIKHKQEWAEVKKYAPVAIIKEMGYFDTNMGMSTVDFIKSKEYGLRERPFEWIGGIFTDSDHRDEVLSKAPSLADELTWCHIWNAVKKEIADTTDLKEGSEEFLKRAGERFTEVVTLTQVYDSVLSRSGMMRSKDTGMKMATSFMAEPTTTMNMAVDAIVQGKRGDVWQTFKSLGAILAAVILNALLVAPIYAARDDDEDETYAEKYVSSLAVELFDGVLPFSYIPFVKDVWSILQGYDVERSDMSIISALAEPLMKFGQTLINKKDDMSAEERKAFGKELASTTISIIGNATSFFGLPVKNIARDVTAGINVFNTFKRGYKTTAMSMKDTVTESVKASVPVWNLFPDKSKADKLYDAIINGDDEYRRRIEDQYKNQDAVDTAIRKALRENDSRIREAAQAEIDGKPSGRVRIAREIVSEGYFSQDNVVKAIKAEVNALNKGEGSSKSSEEDDEDEVVSYYFASDINLALEGGDTSTAKTIINDLVKTKVANGSTEKKAKSSVKQSISTYWKPLYKSASDSERARIRKLLHSTELYGSADEVNETCRNWLKED